MTLSLVAPLPAHAFWGELIAGGFVAHTMATQSAKVSSAISEITSPLKELPAALDRRTKMIEAGTLNKDGFIYIELSTRKNTMSVENYEKVVDGIFDPINETAEHLRLNATDIANIIGSIDLFEHIRRRVRINTAIKEFASLQGKTRFNSGNQYIELIAATVALAEVEEAAKKNLSVINPSAEAARALLVATIASLTGSIINQGLKESQNSMEKILSEAADLERQGKTVDLNTITNKLIPESVQSSIEHVYAATRPFRPTSNNELPGSFAEVKEILAETINYEFKRSINSGETTYTENSPKGRTAKTLFKIIYPIAIVGAIVAGSLTAYSTGSQFSTIMVTFWTLIAGLISEGIIASRYYNRSDKEYRDFIATISKDIKDKLLNRALGGKCAIATGAGAS